MTDNVRKLHDETPDSMNLGSEIGVESSHAVATTLYDDFLPQLRGQQAIRTWREMSLNDATISSILYAITSLTREVDWRTEPFDESSEALRMQDFLNEQIAGLKHPLSDTVSEAFSAFTYGFSFHEVVYRLEPGRVAWDRFSFRPQDTLLRWQLDEKLRPEAFVQTMPRGQTVYIPVETKGILYRTDTTVPSGKSMLRGSYRSWVMKKRAEENLAIGQARNLLGMPMITMPAATLAAGDSDSTYAAMKRLVTRIKRDEQQGILMPSDRDSEGNLVYEFSLVSPNGNPNFDQQIAVVRMHASDILATVLAQFVGLGRDSVGSRALAEPQQQLFQTALNSAMDMLQDVFNRQAVAAIFDLNPSMNGPRPRLVHGEVKDADLAGLADFVVKMSQAGAEMFTGEPDDPMRIQVLELAGFDTDTRVE